MSLVDYILESRNIEGMAHVTAATKGPVLSGFCCGKAFPRQREDSPARAHFTFCPVWQASEDLQRRREEGHQDGRIFDAPEKPKILGEDPEVVAGLLGIDTEQVIREEQRFRNEHPASPEALGGEILQGDAAVLAAGGKQSEGGEDT
jgi:hypothetical protein